MEDEEEARLQFGEGAEIVRKGISGWTEQLEEVEKEEEGETSLGRVRTDLHECCKNITTQSTRKKKKKERGRRWWWRQGGRRRRDETDDVRTIRRVLHVWCGKTVYCLYGNAGLDDENTWFDT